MKDLLAFLTKSIVDHPEEIIVEEKEEDGQTSLNLQANPDDIKMIIGKKGRTIKAIRELLKIRAIKEKRKFSFNLSQ
jgi:uncharacterized protein